jgi:hypothetical protein
MSDVYVYQAALYCEPCGEAIRERLTKEGSAPEDPSDEGSFDSGDFPKGPFADSGGEADSPQHCDACGEFLENPLTQEGLDYVAEAAERGSAVAKEWAEFYGIEIESPEPDDVNDDDGQESEGKDGV